MRLYVTGEEKRFSELERNDTLRLVPASFRECDCGEGRGVFTDKTATTEVIFQESYGDRTTEVTWDGDRLTVELVSLYYLTGLTCKLDYLPATDSRVGAIQKQGTAGNTFNINYAKMIEDTDFEKLAGTKKPDVASSDVTRCGK